MSILGSPRGSPERVYALLYAKRCGAASNAEESLDFVNPGVWADGEYKKAEKTLIADALSNARAFGFDEEVGGDDPPASFVEWADEVHDRLLKVEDGHLDAVLLKAYAWLVAESDRTRDVSWFITISSSDLADAIGAGIGVTADGDPGMNSTKLPAWRRWMTFLGLLARLPLPGARELPAPSRRLHRELIRAGLKQGQELEAGKFLSWLGQRMPYLDGGALFSTAASQIGHRHSPNMLSPVLSLALQDLHEQGVISMRLLGDRSNATQLTGDATHKVTSFHSLTIGAL